jgi:aminoglycoside 3-N-acetyltransferase I
MMEIIELGKSDTDLIGEFFRDFMLDEDDDRTVLASDEYLSGLVSRDDFHVLAAIADRKIVGGLTAYELVKYKREETEMFLYELGVEEEFQRRGIATALIERLKEICREKGIAEIFVATETDNRPARKLYQATGGDLEETAFYTYKLD